VVLLYCLRQGVCTLNHGFVRLVSAAGFFLSLLGFGLRCYVKAWPDFVRVSEPTELQFPAVHPFAAPMAGFFLVAASVVSPLARESACLNLWARGQNSSAGQAAVFRSLGPA
jgi:hypothetical protein